MFAENTRLAEHFCGPSYMSIGLESQNYSNCSPIKVFTATDSDLPTKVINQRKFPRKENDKTKSHSSATMLLAIEMNHAVI